MEFMNTISAEKKVQNSTTPKAFTKKAFNVTPVEHHEQRPRSVSNVGIAHFQKGVAVKIIGTENVLQRIPHLGMKHGMRLSVCTPLPICLFHCFPYFLS
jgi:hypothetical protein